MTIDIHPQSAEGQRLAQAQRIERETRPLAEAATQAAQAVQRCEAEIATLEAALNQHALDDDFDFVTAEQHLSRARRKLPLLRQQSAQAHQIYNATVQPLHELAAIGMRHAEMLRQYDQQIAGCDAEQAQLDRRRGMILAAINRIVGVDAPNTNDLMRDFDLALRYYREQTQKVTGT